MNHQTRNENHQLLDENIDPTLLKSSRRQGEVSDVSSLLPPSLVIGTDVAFGASKITKSLSNPTPKRQPFGELPLTIQNTNNLPSNFILKHRQTTKNQLATSTHKPDKGEPVSPERKKRKNESLTSTNLPKPTVSILRPSTSSCEHHQTQTPPHDKSTEYRTVYNYLQKRETAQCKFYTQEPPSELSSLVRLVFSRVYQQLEEIRKGCDIVHKQQCKENNLDLCRYCYMSEHIFSMSCLYARRICFDPKKSYTLKYTLKKLQQHYAPGGEEEQSIIFKSLALALYRIAVKTIGQELCFNISGMAYFVNLKDKSQQPNIVQMEHFILRDFNFDHLMCVTPISFLSILMNASVCCENAQISMVYRMKLEEPLIETLTNFELLSTDGFITAKPSLLCSGAVAYQRQLLKLDPWPAILQQFTSYSLATLEPIINLFRETNC